MMPPPTSSINGDPITTVATAHGSTNTVNFLPPRTFSSSQIEDQSAGEPVTQSVPQLDQPGTQSVTPLLTGMEARVAAMVESQLAGFQRQIEAVAQQMSQVQPPPPPQGTPRVSMVPMQPLPVMQTQQVPQAQLPPVQHTPQVYHQFPPVQSHTVQLPPSQNRSGQSYDVRAQMGPWPVQIQLEGTLFQRSYRVTDAVMFFQNPRYRASIIAIQETEFPERFIPTHSMVLFGRHVNSSAISVRHCSDRNRVSRPIVSAITNNVLFTLQPAAAINKGFDSAFIFRTGKVGQFTVLALFPAHHGHSEPLQVSFRQ